MHTTWTEKYKVSSFLVNLRGRAGLYAILNFIQDVGWMHAINTNIILPKNQAWVFTRQNLKMNYWPKWNEEVSIKTWLRKPESEAFFFRDYELFVGDQKIGQCTSTFTVIDRETRKIARLDMSKFLPLWNEELSLKQLPEKIIWDGNSKEIAKFEVRNSDLDMNNHVNNTKYAQWILDSLPLDVLKGAVELIEYEVNFLAESKSGDVVSVQEAAAQITEEIYSVIQFQGIRASDQKPIFTARMKIR